MSARRTRAAPARARAECRRPHFETAFAQDDAEAAKTQWRRVRPEFVSRLHLGASLSRVD